MKHTILYIAATAATLLTACTSPVGSGHVSVAPQPLALTTDSNGKVATEFEFVIPKNALPKRSRVVITPQLVMGDTVMQLYRPVVADGRIFARKTTRREALEGYTDPYADLRQYVGKADTTRISYALAAQLPHPGTARVMAAVSADGCGECTGTDTFDVASITRPEPVLLPKHTPLYGTRVKMRHGDGTCHLQFVINKYDIRPEMARNGAELKRMADDIRPILKDTSAVLHQIEICGVASVDGPLAFNTTLSLNRAKAASKWLCDKLGICDADAARLVKLSSRPEGWAPVIEAMREDHHPDAEKVAQVVEEHKNESDDVAERIIRRMSCWPDIRERYLQKDRKVDYRYSFSVKGETETYLIQP